MVVCSWAARGAAPPGARTRKGARTERLTESRRSLETGSARLSSSTCSSGTPRLEAMPPRSSSWKALETRVAADTLDCSVKFITSSPYTARLRLPVVVTLAELDVVAADVLVIANVDELVAAAVALGT